MDRTMKESALLFSLLLTVAACAATDLDDKKTKSSKDEVSTNTYIPGFGGDPSGFFGPGGAAAGGGFNFPGFGGGWVPGGGGWAPGGGGWGAGGGGWGAGGGGWGAGYGGPTGGYARDGVVVPSVVCQDRGPCYKKKVACPASCFTSYSHSGRGGGGGGGGGGCTIDCKKHCIGYC